MYTGKLLLTDNRRNPYALSNNFDDTFGLVDAVADCKSAGEFCMAANKYHNYGKRWSIDKDCKENTRLICEYALGNVKYLIAIKERKTEVVDSKMKQKIIDTMTWYSKADDKGDIVAAREHGQVLYDLLKEIIYQ